MLKKGIYLYFADPFFYNSANFILLMLLLFWCTTNAAGEARTALSCLLFNSLCANASKGWAACV